MKRIIMAGIVILFVIVGLAHAQYRSTPAEARAMLGMAIAFYKVNGPEKALAAFNDPKGSFIKGDLYIFALDLNGKILAHGVKAGLIGKSMREIRDADEKNFIGEMVEVAKSKGAGTVEYKWENPDSLVVERKSSYIQKIDGVILGCGYFTPYSWQEYPPY
jgi:cytochrome c